MPICRTCNEDFWVEVKGEKYCSDRCREIRDRKTGRYRICLECSAEFISSGKKDSFNYCRPCRQGRYMYKPVVRVCRTCTKEFTFEESKYRVYCSDECHPFMINCTTCGTLFKADDRTRKRCSQKCRDLDGNPGGWPKGTPQSKESNTKRSEFVSKSLATRSHYSKKELRLVPVLEQLGFYHNSKEVAVYIRGQGRTRVPDFVDRENKRVFEFFGNYWHRNDNVREIVKWYRELDWECTILWEHELSEFLSRYEVTNGLS